MNKCFQSDTRLYWSRIPLILICVFALSISPGLWAQTGGDGAISGTVMDSSGARVPDATVIAHNINTGVETKRVSSSDGLYNIAPLIPGIYSLTVTASGFSTFTQENLTVYALNNLGINVTLKAGSQDETVTVTAAPPALETTNSALGGTIDNNYVSKLPIMITGLQQRDITQFSNLLPGAQVPPGGRSSIIGGTGQRLGELYVDGLPITTQSQQGDNRPILNIIPLEAIDQVKVVTSGFSAEYQGAGLENYNLKAGTNKYHGAAFGYFRNTAFDAWSFSSKPGGGNTKTVVQNGQLVKVPGSKPAENQNEVGFSVGGPVKIPHLFNGHDKLFFYTAYDKFRSRQAANYSATTVPTQLMRQGNFQELIPVSAGGLGNVPNINYPIYDPTSLANCSAHSTNGPCRYQYGYGPGTGNGKNGNPALIPGGKANVIPASQLSPITQYQQSFLPDPTITTPGTIQNNYLGGVPQGYDNWLYSGRIDYTISDRQTLSAVITGGNRHAIPYTASSAAPLPVPYYASTISIIGGHWADLQHTFTFTPNLVNQFKFGFMNFGGPPVKNISASMGNGKYALAASGITGLPAGQASENAANTVFSGSNAPAGTSTGSSIGWVGNTPTTTNVSDTFTMVDNIQWLKGKHSMNFGGQYQWLQNNASTADGASQPTTLTWSPSETAQITPGGSTYVGNTGYSYASFIVGAVNKADVTLQPFGILGGRFHPFALYFQDDYKVVPKLTLNLGLRWDYIPTYTEQQDRWSFLNPYIANPITGNLGALQFAGERGAGISCNCRTPVNNYHKNYGPRLGFAYAANDKTVIRGGWGVLFSHAGGTGGAGGAATGTGQAGFTSAVSLTASAAGTNAGPAFYLNNNPSFSAPNANFGGPGYVLPGVASITSISQTLGTGYYVCSGQKYAPCNGASGTFSGTGTTIAFPDPYLAGRAPQFIFWNFGVQREIITGITATLNYAGSQSHFLAGASNIRGLQSGQLDPKWLGLGQYLTMPATQVNINTAQDKTGITIPVPYQGYIQAASLSTGGNATIAHMLTWMPQYTSTTDSWGNIANANYHAFQLSIAAREWHGLTMNVNYTYSKNIDDAGTARSGWALPASATLAGHAWAQNRIDRSLSLNSQPQNLSIFGVYSLPFGKGKIGNNNFFVRAVLGGWDFSNIFQYSSGLPLAIVATCSSPQNIGQGQCMPDVNPNFHGSVRVNGGWGSGITAATLGSKKYMTANPGDTVKTQLTGVQGTGSGGASCLSSSGPFCDSSNYMIGDSPRIAPYGLRGMGVYRLTSALRRSFDITERMKFIFGVDCQNVTNTVTFGNNSSNNQIGVNVDAAAFGALNFASGDPRAFQFSGRFAF